MVLLSDKESLSQYIKHMLTRALSPIASEKSIADAFYTLFTDLRNPCEFVGVRVNARLTLVRATTSQDPTTNTNSKLFYNRKTEQRVADQRRQLLLNPSLKCRRRQKPPKRRRLTQKQRIEELTKILEAAPAAISADTPTPANDADLDAERTLMNSSPLLWILDETGQPLKLSDIFVLVGNSSSTNNPSEKNHQWQHIRAWLTNSGALDLWHVLDQHQRTPLHFISHAYLSLNKSLINPSVHCVRVIQ